jgi:hypothetical protein
MATSGKLTDDLANALDLARQTIDTSMKALRKAKLITVKGRGTSAAAMTKEDASTLLIAIGSGASAPHVVRVTQLLKEMAHRNPRVPLQGLEALKNSGHPFLGLPDRHSFFDGLNALLLAEWTDDPEQEEMGQALFNPLNRPEMLAISIGTNGKKSEGFGIIRTVSRTGFTIKNFYSSWPLKPEATEADYELLRAVQSPSNYFSISHFGGEILAAIIRSVREPPKKTRVHPPRVARISRR